MESIYYVVSWACHRKCPHCYEPRFRPYIRGALDTVVSEAVANLPRIIDHFPERMSYLDREAPAPDGALPERRGRIILAGGEILMDPIRTEVAYPAIERIRSRYASSGGVNIVVQTTGDLVTDEIVEELLARGVWMISVSGVDDFHTGMRGAARQAAFKQRLTTLFEAHGVKAASVAISPKPEWMETSGPCYSFFGATPDAWIGRLWPRGRAWENGLSTATLADNFCNRWSGGLNFLQHRYGGSEVAVDPSGNVFPCCLKTKVPIGNLLEDDLISILDSLTGEPAFQAISMGHPERMGLAYGWSQERFLAESQTTTPKGQPYANLCIGCDRFHESVLGPMIERARQRRAERRTAAA
ncbi:MAG: radical SAM protein [Proteobacteria bacterium]|nr:radical SAM protein [Pseudomonadota bacterium]